MRSSASVARAALVALVACGGATEPAPDAGVIAGVSCPPLPEPTGGDLLDRLRTMPGLASVVEEVAPPGYRFFTMTYAQPVDHAATGGAIFPQRLTLLHKAAGAPVVLWTVGYDLTQGSTTTEPAGLLGANQLAVEHRFFGRSRPDPADWSKLTIWQAAADDHCVAAAFHVLYPGPWVSTGASKSGMTAVFHRRFFPDDVDGTVAYVAPLSRSENDPAYVPAVEMGDHPSCRQALRDFRRLALLRRDDLRARLAQLDGQSFTALGPDVALEHAVLELPFSFWQYLDASVCAEIPPATASSDEVFAFVNRVSDFSLYSDADLARFGPYYVQAASELGYPEIDVQGVEDLVQHPGTDIAETYVPAGVATRYDPAPMRDIDAWVRTRGERLLFVYGGDDPWSVGGTFVLGDAVDSFELWVADGNHLAQIAGLADADQQTAVDALKRWTGTR